MRKSIFWSLFLFVIITLVLSLLGGSVLIYREMYQGMQQSAKSTAALVADLVREKGNHVFENVSYASGGQRITIVGPDGTVFYDSKESSNTLENHLERPEIREAIATGHGEARRSSDTLQQQVYYYALALESGEIVRVSAPIKGLFSAMADSLVLLVIAGILLLFFVWLTADRITKKLLQPINQLSLEEPDPTQTYPELQPLVRKLQDKNNKISSQIAVIEQAQRDTTFFLENMREGILLLDQDENIITVNDSALLLLAAPPRYYVGENLLTLTRNRQLLQGVTDSLLGEYTELVISTPQREVEVHTSPVWKEGKAAGVVCFLLDAPTKH